jgi:hypothetical protein
MKYPHQQQEEEEDVEKATPSSETDEDVDDIEEPQDHIDDSEQAAMAAQQVLNAVLDEKAEERDWRRQQQDHHRPITPPNAASVTPPPSKPSPHGVGVGIPLGTNPTPRQRRNEHHESLATTEGDVNLLQLAAERSRGIYRDTDTHSEEDDDEEYCQRLVQEKLQPNDHKKQPSCTQSAGSARTKPAPPATPGAYRATPGQRIQRISDFHHPHTGVGQEVSVESTRSSSNMPPLDEPVVLSAVRVDQDDLELHIRDEICNAAAQAQVVDLEQEANLLVEQKMQQVRKRYCLMTISLTAAMIGAILLGVLLRRSSTNDNISSSVLEEGWTTMPWSTLETIRERGHLHCGLTPRDDSFNYSAPYFEDFIQLFKDMCIAFAAAALDGQPNVTFVVVNERERWTALNNGTLDVLLVGTPAATESLHWNVSTVIWFACPPKEDTVPLTLCVMSIARSRYPR